MNGSGAATLDPTPAPADTSTGTTSDPSPAPGMPVRTAFVIFQDYDGQWVASNDHSLLSPTLTPDKLAHPDEIDAGAAAIRTDIAAQKTAVEIEGRMRRAAQLAANQAANAAVMNNLNLKG